MRKRYFSRILLIGAVCFFPIVVRAQVCATCPSFAKPASIAVKNLASLVGCWEGKRSDGLAARLSYELGSDKTALLETIWIEKNPTMYTIYYLDGKTAMAHHFCSYGNQIRMRMQPSESSDVLLFEFSDATNLPNLDHNHMTYVKFTFLNQNRLDVQWGLHHNGKDLPQPYAFRRVAGTCSARSDNW